MPDGVGVDPPGVRIAYDLRHALEHVRTRFDLHTRIADEQNIVEGSPGELDQGGGRSVFRIDDFQDRAPDSLGRAMMTPAIRLAFKKSPSSCSTTPPRLRDACRT